LPTLQFAFNNKKKALIMTIGAGFLWGTSFPAIKIGLQHMDPFAFVFLRFLVAALTMLLVLTVRRKVNFAFSKKRLVLFLGLTNGIAYLMEYIGMVFTSASKSSLLINLSIIWVAILCPFLLKERLGGKKVAGVILSLLGVFLMTTNLDFGSLGQGTIFGDGLIIGAGIAWAFFMLYNKPLASDNENMFQSMTILLLFTLLPLLPAVFFSAGSIASLGFTSWLFILYTAILCWVVPYYLWLKGLKHLSPVTSAVLLLTEIIVAVTISTLVLGEVFTMVSGLGAVLIVFAILLVS
jgi:drug/metabolite transporter (DMT)-like permease